MGAERWHGSARLWQLVIVKHDNSFLSAYAHNQNPLVKEGQAVSKGQKIAELGDTDSDRPKLHFEIRRQASLWIRANTSRPADGVAGRRRVA